VWGGGEFGDKGSKGEGLGERASEGKGGEEEKKHGKKKIPRIFPTEISEEKNLENGKCEERIKKKKKGKGKGK